jgi:hypothetical protein
MFISMFLPMVNDTHIVLAFLFVYLTEGILKQNIY